MSNRAGKSGVSIRNITSWHQTARALPSPINSLFPPFSLFPFPSPFHTISPFHHSPPHPQIRKRWLTLHASKQAKQAPMSFQKISKFSHWYNTTYKSFIYRYTYLQAPRNKVFFEVYNMRIDSYALLAARHARGRLDFLTPCM